MATSQLELRDDGSSSRDASATLIDRGGPRDVIYQPLAVGWIRLLHIGSEESLRVVCHTKEVEFRHASEYFALSYVWGKADPTQEILLNGKVKRITPTLLAAIKAIQKLQKLEQGALPVWIDAICIDQNSNLEKSRQVPLMGSLFSSAKNVFVWLDNMPSDVEVIFETFKCLSAMLERDILLGCAKRNDTFIGCRDKAISVSCQRLHRFGITERHVLAFKKWMQMLLGVAFDNTSSVPKHTLDDEVARLLGEQSFRNYLSSVNPGFWAALLTFMDHQWFRRIWTYQEIELADAATLLCEDGQLIEWTYVHVCRRTFSIDEVLRYVGESVDLSDEKNADLLRMHARIAMQRGQHQFKIHRPGTLVACLAFATRREATVAKDHVYGLLGLLDQATQSRVLVDYSQSDAAVFMEALKLVISNDPAHLPLIWQAYQDSEPTVEGLPSWCPDLSSQYSVQFPLEKVDTNIRDKYKSFTYVEQGVVSTDLVLTGFDLGGVVRALPRCPKHDFDRHTGHLPSTATPELLTSLLGQEQLYWLQSIPANLQRKLLSDVPGHENDQENLTSLLKICCVLANNKSTTVAVLLRALGSLNPSRMDDLYEFTKSLFGRYRGLCIFETSGGKIGSCLKQVQPGNCIIYVPGGRLLHVLTTDCKEYVGCASVPGLAEEILAPRPLEVRNRLKRFCLS